MDDETTKECPECGADNETEAAVCVDCSADLSAAHDHTDDDDWETMDDGEEEGDEDVGWDEDDDDDEDEL